MNKQIQFDPMQQAITLVEGEPRIAWVTRPIKVQSIRSVVDGVEYVLIACCVEDAQAGNGRWIRLDRLVPYAPDLWVACQRWIGMRENLERMLSDLGRGKIPSGLVQMALIGGGM